MTAGERIAALEVGLRNLVDRFDRHINGTRNGRLLLYLREIAVWGSLVAILLKVFGVI